MSRKQSAVQSRFTATAFGLLWIALIIQIAWTILQASRPIGSLTRPLIFTGGLLLVAMTWGRIRWIALLGRLIVGGAFLSALLPRFSNFEGFVRYTERVNSFLPHQVIPTLAVLATVVECVLSVAMLLGIKTRWAAGGSALLLCLFATAMTISGLSQAEWAVYVLSAGAFALATSDASLLSVDSFIASRSRFRALSPPDRIPHASQPRIEQRP
jgi:thiosulfate dehydrogenase [quinone] large subunit